MVKAIFKKKTIWDYVCLFCGLFLIGLFIYVGYKDSEATVGGVLTGVVLGMVFCSFGLIMLLFNYKAYLSVEDGHIKGKYHYFGKINCAASNVAFAMPQINTLSILMKNGKQYVIRGVENQWELATDIRRQIFALETESPESLYGKLQAKQTERNKKLLWVIVGVVMMFANIFIAVALTGGREMYDFTTLDWTLFAVMGVVELATMVATFWVARQCGKYVLPIEQLKYRLKGAYIASQSLPSGNAKYVYTDENQTGRIIVYDFPNDESVYCCVQEFVGNLQFETVHTSEIYASEEDLPTEALDALLNITDHFL